jgi:hypothetical protein
MELFANLFVAVLSLHVCWQRSLCLLGEMKLWALNLELENNATYSSRLGLVLLPKYLVRAVILLLFCKCSLPSSHACLCKPHMPARIHVNSQQEICVS